VLTNVCCPAYIIRPIPQHLDARTRTSVTKTNPFASPFFAFIIFHQLSFAFVFFQKHAITSINFILSLVLKYWFHSDCVDILNSFFSDHIPKTKTLVWILFLACFFWCTSTTLALGLCPSVTFTHKVQLMWRMTGGSSDCKNVSQPQPNKFKWLDEAWRFTIMSLQLHNLRSSTFERTSASTPLTFGPPQKASSVEL